MRTSDAMPRGARLAATLLVCLDRRLRRPHHASRAGAGGADAGEIGLREAAADAAALSRREPTMPAPEPMLRTRRRRPGRRPRSSAPRSTSAPTELGRCAPPSDGPPVADGGDGGTDRPAADAPAAILMVDDFADGTVSPNALGGPVSGDNQSLALVAGELSFNWNSTGVFQSFRQLLTPSSCARDLPRLPHFLVPHARLGPGQAGQLLPGPHGRDLRHPNLRLRWAPSARPRR